MPYSETNPPERIKGLPKKAQRIFVAVYNSAIKDYKDDEERVNKIAWGAVKRKFKQNEDGEWVAKGARIMSMKIGARHSADDTKRIQEIHDHAEALGAKCGEEQKGKGAEEDLALEMASKARAAKAIEQMAGAAKQYESYPEPLKTRYAIEDCYDVSQAARVLADVSFLVEGEAEENDDLKSLFGIMRSLVEFISGEIDDLEEATLMPDEYKAWKKFIGEFKAIGEREDVSAADRKRAAGEAEQFTDEKNKKYKLDNEEQIRAAWNYIHQERNAGKYSADEVATIKRKIVAAWKDKIDKDGPPSAEKEEKAAHSHYHEHDGMEGGGHSHYHDHEQGVVHSSKEAHDHEHSSKSMKMGAHSHFHQHEGAEEGHSHFHDHEAGIDHDSKAAHDHTHGKSAIQIPAYVKSLNLPLSEQFFRDVLAAKFIGKDEIQHYTNLWGDPNKVDIETEFFTGNGTMPSLGDTDFWDGGLGFPRPLTWQPGQDRKAMDNAPDIIGEIQEFQDDKVGRFARSILKRSHDYRSALDDLLGKRVLGTSSDSAPQYVVRQKVGKAIWLKQWPFFAAALTDVPAEPRMLDIGNPYWKAIGVSDPGAEVSRVATRVPRQMRIAVAKLQDLKQFVKE